MALLDTRFRARMLGRARLWMFVAPQSRKPCSVILLCVCLVSLLASRLASAAERPARLAIVVGEKAPPLERMAAEELAGMLRCLFEGSVEVASRLAPRATSLILIGQPETNSTLAA